MLSDVDRRQVEATAGAFIGLSRLLLTEPDPLRWTGALVPLTEGLDVWAVRSDYVRGEEVVSGIELVAEADQLTEAQGRALRYMAATGRWVAARERALPGAEMRVAGAWLESVAEYRAVAELYGDGRAARSGVRLIEHVHEGLAVLRALGAGEVVLRAFCLHPLVQADEALRATMSGARLASADPEAVALALEYRSVANAFLSPMETHPGYDNPQAIRRSPLAEVDAMLIADKIQNAKDFGLYHRRSHPRAAWLARYFDSWLAALEVAPAQAREWTSLITAPTVRVMPAEPTSAASA